MSGTLSTSIASWTPRKPLEMCVKQLTRGSRRRMLGLCTHDNSAEMINEGRPRNPKPGGLPPMDATKTAALDTLISQLDAQIRAVENLKIPGTKLLLTMARLDLQAKRYDIRDHELKALCVSIENAIDADHERRRGARPSKRSAGVRTKTARPAARPVARQAPANEPRPSA